MNYISPVNHPESYLTGSTIESMIDRTKELGLNYFAITDHAYLTSVLKGYMYGQKKEIKIKIIAGVEIFFKDNSCPLILNTPAEKIKYYKMVVHAKDQTAYQYLVKMISNSKQKKVIVGENSYPIYKWKDIEELCKQNITISTSNVEDIVVKNLLIDQPQIALQYYQRLRGLVGPENFFPAIIPYEHNQYWNEIVEVKVDKGGNSVTVQIPAYDKVDITEIETKNGKESFSSFPQSMAIDLTKRKNKGKIIDYVYINKIKYKVNKKVISAKLVNSFRDIPNGDLQLKANKTILSFAERMGDKVLISNYSYYANQDDSVVQDMKMGENKRIAQKQFIRSLDDSKEYLQNKLGLSEEKISELVNNTHEWANIFKDFELKYNYRLPDCGANPEKTMIDIIKAKGRMKWDNPVYVKQFREEYNLLVNNGILNLVPYFLPILDVFKSYEEDGYLTGPARGSAGGFLLSYVMGVTHLDPIKYGLSSSRFLTIDRIQQGNLPDIDVDLESRVPLVGKDGFSGYLYKKYGNKAAQVSTRTLLRIKSAMLDANRFVNKGTVEDSIAALSKSFPTTPQGISDSKFVFGYEDADGHRVEGLMEQSNDLQKYAVERPEEWNIVKRALSLSRQNSRHACAYIISDAPIEETVPVFNVGGVERVTMPEHKQCEWAGLIKYDFLVVSAVKDIRMAIDYINEKNGDKMKPGHFMRDGKEMYIWDIPEEKEVFKMLQAGKTETVFQLNTITATPLVMQAKVDSVLESAVITSLGRPGPLDFKDPETGRTMPYEYIERKFGRSKCSMPILNELIPETYGVLVYQEQIVKIAVEMGMGVIDAENVRIAMGKKKIELLNSLKPKFIEMASKRIGEADAENLWSMMATFGRYGFNKSHAVAYSLISYACAYLKYYYPLEWWAAVLSNAKNKEINEVFYKYVKDMVLPPDINLSTEKMSVDYREGKIRNKLSMITGVGEKLAEKIIDGRPYDGIQDFVNKMPCGHSMSRKLIHIGALDSLFEPNTPLLKKMKIFEDAVMQKEFENKVKDYDAKIIELENKGDVKGASRTIKNKERYIQNGVGESTVDQTYIGMTPQRDFLIKKTVFPTINIDLHKIVSEHSVNQVIDNVQYKSMIHPIYKEEVKLLSGEFLQRLDETNVNKGFAKVCCAGYIVDSSEFTYKNGSRKALKLIIDTSGYLSEKVIWPDYETGILEYPEWIQKGAVVIFFYQKNEGKPYTNISGYLLEHRTL